jgi:DNA-binding beta-propeller fold protein YncE
VSSTSGGIVALDLESGAVAMTYPVPGALQDLAISPDGTELYAADETGGVIAMTTANGAVRRLPTAPSFGLTMSLDGTQLWITQPSVGRILVVDRAQFAVMRTISGGTIVSPRRIAFDQSGPAIVSDEAGYVHIFR